MSSHHVTSGLGAAALLLSAAVFSVASTTAHADARSICRPLLTAVKPASEAFRVFDNCLALQTKKGYVTCPNGRMQRVGYNRNRC